MKQAKPRDVRPVQSRHAHTGRKTNGWSSDDLHARVAKLAYAFYERRGREDGHDVEDWIQAEKTILDEIASKEQRIRSRSKV
jgi:hypothetical protein